VLHGAGSFSTIDATFRVWHHTERAQAAFRAATEEDKRRGASIQTVTLRGRREEPSERVETVRIWRSGDRVREEQHGGPRDGYYGVRDGEVWWSWDERMGAVSNEDDPSVGSGIGEQLSIMLDPTPLLAALQFRVVGASEVAGRPTILAEAVPRASDPRRPQRAFELHQFGNGADVHALEVESSAAFSCVLSRSVAENHFRRRGSPDGRQTGQRNRKTSARSATAQLPP
jgi:hypothetical protein